MNTYRVPITSIVEVQAENALVALRTVQQHCRVISPSSILVRSPKSRDAHWVHLRKPPLTFGRPVLVRARRIVLP